MTKKELIEPLSDQPDDAEIFIGRPGGEMTTIHSVVTGGTYGDRRIIRLIGRDCLKATFEHVAARRIA